MSDSVAFYLSILSRSRRLEDWLRGLQCTERANRPFPIPVSKGGVVNAQDWPAAIS